MVGDGIVYVGPDPIHAERLPDVVAAWGADHIQVRDVVEVYGRRREREPAGGQTGGILRGDLTAAGVPFVEMRQFGAQDGGLDLIHAAVLATGKRRAVFTRPAVLSEG